MIGYSIANLEHLIEELGEDRTKEILSSFSCALNPDVEKFLKEKAIEFSKQSISATHLVFTSFKDDIVLIGYFTLANKVLTINKSTLSKSLAKKISKFGVYEKDLKAFNLSCPLIAQLGKNFSNGYNELIKGDELLGLACDEIERVQLSVGGKLAYVECEDRTCLIEFYEEHGFKRINNRMLTKVEKTDDTPEYLVQLIKRF